MWSGIECGSSRTYLTLFGNDIEEWLVSWTSDTCVVLDEGLVSRAKVLTSVHVSWKSVLWSISWDDSFWFGSSVWLPSFSGWRLSSLYASFGFDVEDFSGWASKTLTGGHIEDRFWFFTKNTLKSIPKRGFFSTVGDSVVNCDSVNVIFNEIIHSNTA